MVWYSVVTILQTYITSNLWIHKILFPRNGFIIQHKPQEQPLVSPFIKILHTPENFSSNPTVGLLYHEFLGNKILIVCSDQLKTFISASSIKATVPHIITLLYKVHLGRFVGTVTLTDADIEVYSAKQGSNFRTNHIWLFSAHHVMLQFIKLLPSHINSEVYFNHIWHLFRKCTGSLSNIHLKKVLTS